MIKTSGFLIQVGLIAVLLSACDNGSSGPDGNNNGNNNNTDSGNQTQSTTDTSQTTTQSNTFTSTLTNNVTDTGSNTSTDTDSDTSTTSTTQTNVNTGTFTQTGSETSTQTGSNTSTVTNTHTDTEPQVDPDGVELIIYPEGNIDMVAAGGNEIKLFAMLYDKNGQLIINDDSLKLEVTYTSSDESILLVEDSGFIKGVHFEGTSFDFLREATVTVKVKGMNLSVTKNITVWANNSYQRPVQRLEVDQETVSLQLGADTELLINGGIFASAAELDCSKQNFAYSVVDSSIVDLTDSFIFEAGTDQIEYRTIQISAKKEGITVLNASCDGVNIRPVLIEVRADATVDFP
ncbi:MAG: hypothetical protein HRU38_17460, partial [Saccharospirillaceae bacterium]|nr:hypothetical protein [Pseudomonadales bacterium]NRB80427.1 hypothetical protein [Saccharospirillaceae bacterium]